MLSISTCRTRRDRQRFEAVSESLLASYPAFVPPFPGSVGKYLSEDSAFRREHGTITPFLATRDSKVVGRIAAITNRTHNARYKDRTGFFGFFECEDNDETARALVDKAASVLSESGFDTLRGPYNPSINDECGVLVEGHHRAPCIGLTWNPPFYERLLVNAGMAPVRKAYGYLMPLTKLEIPDRLKRLGQRVAARSRMRLRPINLKRLKDELAIVHQVYNSTLERNWGFVPISLNELLTAASDMRAIADPALILIAEKDGQPAGVALSLPNFNEILALAKSAPRWIRPLRILWLMKTRKIKSGRQVVYGILPQYRDRGLHAWLLYEQFVRAKERYDYAELGWIEESNSEIIENALMVGGIQDRLWKIYEKRIA